MIAFPSDGSDDDYTDLAPKVGGSHSVGYQAIHEKPASQKSDGSQKGDGSTASNQPLPASFLSIFLALLSSLLLKL